MYCSNARATAHNYAVIDSLTSNDSYLLNGKWPAAIFTTSEIQSLGEAVVGNGVIETKLESTGKLEKAIAMGYEVYVITTRSSFFPHSDKWWMKLVKPENVYAPSAELLTEEFQEVNSPALLSPWIRLCERLGLDHPTFKNWTDAQSWFHHETMLRLGIIFKP